MSIQTPATAPLAGNVPATEDLGPLAWVLGEIQKSLDGVGKSLRRFVRDVGSASDLESGPLQMARQQLHQSVGALQMVGNNAPALVLGSIEFAVQGFIAEPQRCTDSAVLKIERAGFAVVDFLHALRTVRSVAASSRPVGTACAQKNSRSWPRRSETALSPRASVAYCSSTREAARLT